MSYNAIPGVVVVLVLAPHPFQVIPSIVTLSQDTKCSPPLHVATLYSRIVRYIQLL